jgi:hypothetical protein
MRRTVPVRVSGRRAARFVAVTLTAMVVGAAGPSRASAQVVLGILFGDKLASDNFNIGFEIGMNLSTVTDLSGAAVTRGTLLGLFGTWRFSEHYHLFTGLLPLSAKGAKDADAIPLNDPLLDPTIAGRTMERNLGYIDIPVLVQWAQHRDGGVRIGAGPQIGILLSANDRYSAITPQGTAVVIENDIENDIERFDAGIAFDAEYRITGLGLAIGVRYYQGLTDLLRGSGPSLHNQVLSGSGRITLGGRKPKPAAEPKGQ